MMQNRTQNSRGAIIIDASILYQMTTRLPSDFVDVQHYQSDEPKYLWSLILFLADNDYEIIIPEIVAHKAASILRDGKSSAKYFSKSLNPKRSIIKNFLVGAMRREQLSIYPPPPTDTSVAQKFINKLWDIHKSEVSDRIKKNQIIRCYKNTDTCNFTGIAAHEIIRYMAPESTLIFYLSDDGEALNEALKIRQDVSVHPLTCADLLATFNEEGLFPLIGINPSKIDLLQQLIETTHTAKLQTDCAQSNPTNRQFFVETLKGIRVKTEENNTVTADEIPDQPCDRIAKFHKKYGHPVN